MNKIDNNMVQETMPDPKQSESAFVSYDDFDVTDESAQVGVPLDDSGKTRVVGIRFKDFGKVYHFSPGEYEFEPGDGVIVETVRGIEYAVVTSMVTAIENSRLTLPLKSVVRKATPADIARVEANKAREKEALELCAKRIQEHNLEMTLITCDFGFDNNRITFYFTADGRVDFRELVRDLAGVFKARIELRQIGVRDKAKLFGGVGACGRCVCCASFLSAFEPVSIKMAKDQNIALSPTKISGICGRLMCCLKYEQDSYEQMRNKMPRIHAEVSTPDGAGIVIDNNVLTERIKVKITLPDGTPELREYPLSEVTFARKCKSNCADCPEQPSNNGE